MISLKTMPNVNRWNTTKWHARTNSTFNKKDKAPGPKIRMLYLWFGTLEGLLRLLSTKECEGSLSLSICSGGSHMEIDITTPLDLVTKDVRDIVVEIAALADAIAQTFATNDVEVTATFAQTLSYDNSPSPVTN